MAALGRTWHHGIALTHRGQTGRVRVTIRCCTCSICGLGTWHRSTADTHGPTLRAKPWSLDTPKYQSDEKQVEQSKGRNCFWLLGDIEHKACASYRDEHLMDWSKEVYMNVHETRPTKTMPTKSYDRTGFASPFCRALQVGMSLQYWNAWNSDLYGSIASSSMSWDINHTLPTGPTSCPRRPFVASKRVHPRHWCGTCCIICCWPKCGWTWCLGSSKEKMLYKVRKHGTRATGAVLSLWNAPIYVELVWKSIWPCWPLPNLSAKPTWRTSHAKNMSERYCSLGGNIDNLAWF